MTPIDRRRALAGLLALSPVAGAFAQANRTTRLIVGYSPGGAVDIIARSLAQAIGPKLGQTVIVDNRPGGATNIALRALIDSPPDGATLMLAANALAANVSLYQPAPYALKDVTPIAQIGRVPVVLAANANAGIASIKAMVEGLKSRPGSLNYGTPGNGSTPHLAIELFAHAAKVELTHVPYKGGSNAMNDVIAGHVPLVAVNALEVLPHVRAGKLHVLAVLSAQRSPIYPDAPTIAESGYPGFEASVWYGLIGPAGLPAAAVVRLNEAVQQALQAPELKERLAGAGGEVTPGAPAAFAALLAAEQQRYAALIRGARITPD